MNRFESSEGVKFPWSMASSADGNSLYLLESDESIVRIFFAPFNAGWTIGVKSPGRIQVWEHTVVAPLDADPRQVMQKMIFKLTSMGANLSEDGVFGALGDQLREQGVELCRVAEHLAQVLGDEGLAREARSHLT